MKKTKFGFLCIVLATSSLLVSSCSSGWLGGKDNKDKLKGERIDVLKNNQGLSIDKSIAKTSLNIEAPVANSQWVKSQLYQLSQGNLLLSSDKLKSTRTSIGDYDSENQIRALPIVADDKIFTIDTYGKITAFEADNLDKKIWDYNIKLDIDKDNRFFNAGMTYSDGKIYVSSGQLTLLAINAKDGSLIWQRKLNNIVSSAPTVAGGLVFISTANSYLYALNASDGAINWTNAGLPSDISMLGSASPLVEKRLVFVPYSSGELVALDVLSGNQIWSNSLVKTDNKTQLSLSNINAQPISYKNLVIATSCDGFLAAFNAISGTTAWKQEISSNFTPWVSGDYLYVLNKNNQLVSLNLTNGAIRFIVDLPDDRKKDDEDKAPLRWAGPVMANSLLWIVGSHGKLIGLSPNDGLVSREVKIDKNIFLPPVIAKGTMFLLKDNADLIAVRP